MSQKVTFTDNEAGSQFIQRALLGLHEHLLTSVEFAHAGHSVLECGISRELSPTMPLPLELPIPVTHSKYVLTLLSKPILVNQLSVLFDAIVACGLVTTHIHTLSEPDDALFVLDIKLHVPLVIDVAELRAFFYTLSCQMGVDLALQPDDAFRQHKRLFVFDMDSTLIQQEVIDEIARIAGVVDQVSSITEAAMRGEIDFKESLRQRVSLLKGTPGTVFDQVRECITFTPGVVELTRILKHLGCGFVPMAEYVKRTLGLDYAFANNLQTSPDGTLIGETHGEIVDGEKKKELLLMLAKTEGCQLSQVVAVGDGANDLKMMGAAGQGIAWNAKPKVQAQADMRLNQTSLINVLYLMGFTRREIDQLRDSSL